MPSSGWKLVNAIKAVEGASVDIDMTLATLIVEYQSYDKIKDAIKRRFGVEVSNSLVKHYRYKLNIRSVLLLLADVYRRSHALRNAE